MNKKYILVILAIVICYIYPLVAVCQEDMDFLLAESGTGSDREIRHIGVVKEVASDQRIMSYGILEKELVINISEEDYDVLLRIVEAEAGGEDEDGKMLVANVILNRVNNEKFPDTVKDVVFQRENGTAQFSPITDGRYENVTISKETVDAVNRVLEGEDNSQGALYFVSRKAADPEKMKWFDTCLEFLFEHGGHEFFS